MNKKAAGQDALATSQDAGAPQDETPGRPREKRKRNTAPGGKVEKIRPNERKKEKSQTEATDHN